MLAESSMPTFKRPLEKLSSPSVFLWCPQGAKAKAKPNQTKNKPPTKKQNRTKPKQNKNILFCLVLFLPDTNKASNI